MGSNPTVTATLPTRRAALMGLPALGIASGAAAADADWAQLGRYRDADAALQASGRRPDVVFMGDSITELWLERAPAFFRPGRVDRGISGQTTPQMLLRFRQDVIDLSPRAVHIMGGTNDVAGNTGPMSAADTQANLQSMVDLALAHHIRVILAAIPPASAFPWRPDARPAPRIAELNGWTRRYATRVGAGFVDYGSVLGDGQGGAQRALAPDGVHPNAAGYAAMAPLAERAIAGEMRR